LRADDLRNAVERWLGAAPLGFRLAASLRAAAAGVQTGIVDVTSRLRALDLTSGGDRAGVTSGVGGGHAAEHGGGERGQLVLGACADVRDDLGGGEVAEAAARVQTGPPA